ncbi:hypothetical protein LSCM4_01782 [Leishmania orientalis]|uniref:Uncharacterized protein n=1 Tax=Leishmania orientalis TaxID=2249476 RepID=A0A836HD19_9TRYP|nr:hypothetical protein LSCM4_01782 [Leishmania orientalis]
MRDASSLLEALLVAKKQQATELFGPWDVEDSGRIAIAHLRPLLLSVFPLPSALSLRGSAAAADHLSVSHVKRAYESVTGRLWAPRPLPSVASTSAQTIHRCQELMCMGPTLNEVHAIIDFLCGVEAQMKGASARESADGKEDASMSLLEARKPPLSNTALSTHMGGAARSGTGAMTAVHAPFPAYDPRAAFLYGSVEAIYRTFCIAAVSPGESVPTTLPIDAAHLQRLAWNANAQRLRLGEGHALQRLLAAKATAADVATPTHEGDSCLTLEGFVRLLCAI